MSTILKVGFVWAFTLWAVSMVYAIVGAIDKWL